jgi:hypothetical protein
VSKAARDGCGVKIAARYDGSQGVEEMTLGKFYHSVRKS